MSLTHVCIVGSHGVNRDLTAVNHYLPSYWPCCNIRTTKCTNINPVLGDPKRFSRPSLNWSLIYETLHDIYGGKTFWCFNVPAGGLTPWGVNSSLPGQNGRHFAADIFMCISLNVKVQISIKMSLKFVPKGPIKNIPALVQIMAWRMLGTIFDSHIWFGIRTHLPMGGVPVISNYGSVIFQINLAIDIFWQLI